jgi:hypothetical protein
MGSRFGGLSRRPFFFAAARDGATIRHNSRG